jgi:hypothetical protein
MCVVSKMVWAREGQAERFNKNHTANFMVDLPYMMFGF